MQNEAENIKQDDVFVEDGVLNIVFKGERKTTEDRIAQATLIRDKVFKILKENPDKEYDVIVDFIFPGGRAMYPAQARKIGADIMRHPRLKKWAIASPSKVKKVTTFMIAFMIGKDAGDLAWFQTREEALEWLKEDD